ncbi:MAG: hypothetical protein JRH01_22645 [Deltaproteobacteria bacterium]|nr:hypothetical protein [Deltaproteobacteria bacterium]MBW2392946.1 hypothetical protein [Deltaproteobacteria bacterium]
MRVASLGLLLCLGLASGLSTACSITRVYRGSPIRAVPDEVLQAGVTNKAQVLQILGPPDRIVRQHDGDAFLYRYVRRNVDSLELEEPVFTNLTVFSYTRNEQRADLLLVLFDKEGVVVSWGLRRSTEDIGVL